MDLQNRPRKHASADGWSIATALGLLAGAFVWDRMAPAQPKESGGLEPKEDQKPASHPPPASSPKAETAAGTRRRRRSIPARGWKDILWRVYGNIGNHRILALAAGMTYFSILAIFPALAALVSIYGIFSTPAASPSISTSSAASSWAARSTRRASSSPASPPAGDRTLGFTFAIGLAISLWSANAAMKSFFDTLNIAYGEQEKRGFLNAECHLARLHPRRHRLHPARSWLPSPLYP